MSAKNISVPARPDEGVWFVNVPHTANVHTNHSVYLQRESTDCRVCDMFSPNC